MTYVVRETHETNINNNNSNRINSKCCNCSSASTQALKRSFFLMSLYVWRTCVCFNTTFQHANRLNLLIPTNNIIKTSVPHFAKAVRLRWAAVNRYEYIRTKAYPVLQVNGRAMKSKYYSSLPLRAIELLTFSVSLVSFAAIPVCLASQRV
jgi:hypothetical protein